MLGQIKLWLNIINIKYHMFICYTFIFSLSLYLSLCWRKKFIFCVVLIFTAKACRYSDGVTHAHGTWWQDGCSADAKNCTCNDGIAKCLRLWVPCILQCKFQWKANGAFLCFSWYIPCERKTDKWLDCCVWWFTAQRYIQRDVFSKLKEC